MKMVPHKNVCVGVIDFKKSFMTHFLIRAQNMTPIYHIYDPIGIDTNAANMIESAS